MTRDFNILDTNSTIGDLPLEAYMVTAKTPVPDLGRMFSVRPEMFGVMVYEGNACVGVVSRTMYTELMVRPYLPELYQRRTVHQLLMTKGVSPMRLPAETAIGDAGEMALSRPSELRYEPLLVDMPSGEVKLLSADTLLISMARRLQAEVLANREALRQVNEAQSRLRAMVRTDPLTGVANRRSMAESLAMAYEHARRSGSPISVIMLDVDFFKKFNDFYGHQAGDTCLKAVAATIAQSTKRTADVVARYGGEEFILVLPDTPLAGAKILADQIRKAVEALNIPHAASKVADHVTVSLGIATHRPRQDESPDSLIADADRALYTAKANGRNRSYAEATAEQDRNLIFQS